MNTPIPQKDLEALSAYLDNQLTEKEKASLDSRLQSDEALRVSLSEIQTTRQMLRKTPRLRAPRNFILTPEMAGVTTKKPMLGLFNSFRFAFVMTSILFALIVVGDLGNFLPGNLPVAQSPIAESSADTVAEEAAAGDTALEAETLAFTEPDVEALGGSEAASDDSEFGMDEAAPAEDPSIAADEVASEEQSDTFSDDDAFSQSAEDGTDDTAEDTSTISEETASQSRATATATPQTELLEVEEPSVADEEAMALKSPELEALPSSETPQFQQPVENEDSIRTTSENLSQADETTITTISTTRIITWLIEAFLAGLLIFLSIGMFVLWRRR